MKDENKNNWIAIQFRVRKIDVNLLSLRPVDFLIGNYEADIDEFIDEKGFHYNDVCDVAGHNVGKGTIGFFGFPCKIERMVQNFKEKWGNGEIEKESLYNDYFVDASQHEYMCHISNEDIQKKSKNCICFSDSTEKFAIDMFKDLYTALDTKKIYLEEEEIFAEFNPIEVLKRINERVIAQEEAAKQLVNTIYLNQKYNEYEGIKSNILIIGPPGTGKTELIRSLVQETDIPLVIADSTKYTCSGYVGRSVDSILEDLYRRSGENLDRVEKGIIVIDEADKLCSTDEKNTVRKKDVQEELLGMIEGNVYSTEFGDIDTSKITFILLGAFSSLTNTEVKKQSLGFEVKESVNTYVQPSTEKLYEYGMSAELLRRLPVRIYTNPLSKDDLKKILTKSKISNLRIFEQALMEKDNIKLVYNEDTLDAIVDKASNYKGGASGLKSAVTNTLLEAVIGIRGISNADLIISPKTVENPKEYKVKKKTKEKKNCELSESNG